MDFNRFLLFDGAMGTMLQRRGLKAGQLPELLNLSQPEIVEAVHREYVNAGADIITANTFGCNSFKLRGAADVTKTVTAAVAIAKRSKAKYVALDVGPTGELIEPMGTASFEDLYNAFCEEIKAGANAGADLVIIETMSDLLEAKAAVLAAKDCCKLPVIASMTYAEGGRTFIGTDAITATITLCALGVDAVGANCSLGPAELMPIVKDILDYSSVPVIIQANAGLPYVVDGETRFPVKPDEYNGYVKMLIDAGVSVFGGCCGTTPEYIALMRKTLDSSSYKPHPNKSFSAFTSGRKSVIIQCNTTAVIGERINPTGKKRLQLALREKDYSYAVDEALTQEDHGADILDVNAGLPDIDEKETLVSLVKEIQAVCPLPLQIDSSDPVALEAAVRIYNGKPIINSVNGKEDSLSSILPIAAKYGAAVVALTLDENGIPQTAQGRLEIARKILNRAFDYGIRREDVLVDCLVLTASTNQSEVLETLNAIKLVKNELGVKTVLGVSNVSFGLPSRELINSVFLASAFGAGLNLPILNPLSEEYRKTVSAFKVLNNEDKGSVSFLAQRMADGDTHIKSDTDDIIELIISGRKDIIATAVKKALSTLSPLEIINNMIVPALDTVGNKFENGVFYLPQLMASADAVKAGFEALAAEMPPEDANKGTVILATVKGDIHDIGKNIVKTMLENYGFGVIDLGKDVTPEVIVEAAKQNNVKLIGLSALMTTTVKYMEETIKLLRECKVDAKIMVGGAVLTEEYAKTVGADFYSKDAAQAVNIAKSVFDRN